MLNNCFGRFLSPKHAQACSGEPEVAIASKVSHNARQNFINRIGTISKVMDTKFYQNINHRSRDNVKESVINNNFDVA